MSNKSSRPPLSRRAFIGALAGAAATARFAAPAKPLKRKPGQRLHVAVVGAGAFGGFTAAELLRRGARVTLLDAWGPGNARASSGGETRVIRGVYGADRIYTEMAARAFRLWHEYEARWKRPFYRRTGALWLVGDDGAYVKSSLPILRDNGFAYEELAIAEASKRFPGIDFSGISSTLFEKEAGYLLARRACAQVVEGFTTDGGSYRVAAVTPGAIASGRLDGLKLSDATTLTADAYVFACGPWLPKIFPELLRETIQPTRQEVFYFGTPAGDRSFDEDRFPVWVEVPRFFYGIPGNERRGFKIADDGRGAPFDPTDGDRIASAEGLKSARDFIARRFPALANAPLLETRVCQYENSLDHHFVIDRHPGAENAWIVGGGSGHGFKHGPAVGEIAARAVLGERAPDRLFSLSRSRTAGA
ncbi:MAG: FAD-dependent oxidoreductase [Acidobacteriota bacterium]|nr:FAD-dependent oxidoreductase [Acidobacteriota bacterium]